MRVAFLGLGIMGSGMASNLVKHGHQVTTWNRSPKQVEGATSAQSPKAAVEGAEAVWICVSDTAAVEQVLFGAEGAAEALRPGIVVADSSTISPVASEKFAERIRAKGADFVDAPVTGSKIGAKEGTLIFIAGGKQESVERLDPLFKAMGKQVIHVGDNGKGEAAKLAMNLMIVLIYEGFIEAMMLAKNLGVDQKALFSLIQASMVRSGVVDYKMPFVEKRDFTPNFPLRLMHKDIRLMLEAAQATSTRLPGLEKIKEIYDEAHEAGLSELDYASTLQILERKD
ncbi:MAG TPA: NAD(P)-dependent oxidoreductase [Terriglobales bacterium]|nr:NAD(P)-dependent oxidoreductase [Terriglobales bacterium]